MKNLAEFVPYAKWKFDDLVLVLCAFPLSGFEVSSRP
jgi:hypothetical protein